MSVLQKNNGLPFPHSFNYLFHFRTVKVKIKTAKLSTKPPPTLPHIFLEGLLHCTTQFSLRFTKIISNICKGKKQTKKPTLNSRSQAE